MEDNRQDELWRVEFPEDGNEEERREETRAKYRKRVRKTCSRLGWSLTAIWGISLAVGFIFAYFNFDGLSMPVITVLGYIAAALPVYLLLRGVPAVIPERKKMRLRKLIMFYVLVQGFGYLFNVTGNLINMAVAAAMGRDVLNMNPVNDMLAVPDLSMMIYIAIVGPIIEEYIFRWIVLNRLRPFGEKAAILFSALMFGLLHGNLTQTLYATAIGIILGYVAVKTGRMIYNCLLHIVINSGTLVLAFLLQGDVVLQLLAGIATLAAVAGYTVAAIIIICLNVRRTKLMPGDWPSGITYRDFSSAMYLNPGVLSFVIISGIMIALYLFVF